MICKRCVLLFIAIAVSPSWTWAIDPVRPGDKVEVLSVGSWVPGEVLLYEKGQALVRYVWIREKEGTFNLDKIRFPNSEGSWMIWRDVSGKFQIPARLVGRTDTHVKLLKENGETIEVPIEKLADSLKNRLNRLMEAEKRIVDASLVRVGDVVEYKRFSTWYTATVDSLLPTGAHIRYFDGTWDRQADADYKDLRYPNGEGPWADWTDSSGKHKVKARYLTHDETHVELLLQGGKQIRLERSKLAVSIESGLVQRPILTRRPGEVEFDMSRVSYEKLPSWTSFGTTASKDRSLLKATVPSRAVNMDEGTFDIALNAQGKIQFIDLVSGETNWLVLATAPTDSESPEPVSLQWVNLASQSTAPGPNFLRGEVVLGYSVEQQRLLTAEGLDLRGSASRLCTYRLAPGDSKATPELKWSVPKVSFFSSQNEMQAAFVGHDRLLVGYGESVTMFNLASKSAEYVVPSKSSKLNITPDQRYVLTNQVSHSVAIDTSTGAPAVDVKNSHSAQVSQDGGYLATSSLQRPELTDLSQPERVFSLPGYSQTTSRGRPAVVDQKWFCDGSNLWDLERQMLVWTYNVEGMGLVLQRVLGDKLIVVGQAENTSRLIVGSTRIASPVVQNSVQNVSDEQLYILRPGIRVRVESNVQNSRMLSGIRRAIETAGWTEDPTSDIIISAEAHRGAAETHHYHLSRFGSRGGGSDEVTITASPWLQSLAITHQGQTVWSAGSGGVPSFFSVREGESTEAAVRQCETESYSLFDNLTFPEKVISPKWEFGFGVSALTPNGIVDSPKIP